MSQTTSQGHWNVGSRILLRHFFARSLIDAIFAISSNKNGRTNTSDLETTMSTQPKTRSLRSTIAHRRDAVGVLVGRPRQFLLATVSATLVALAPATFAAQLTLSTVPLFLTSTTKPNVVLIYDNSQSMDATMAGKLIAGDDLTTRGNIGRQVLRNTITAYRDSFRWGLMSFAYSGAAARYNTYPYFLGNATGMVFTTDCTSLVTDPYTFLPSGANAQIGVSASNGGRRCITNPDSFAGGTFVTFDKTGDDPDINDVLYDPRAFTRLWGLSSGGTNYNIYTGHNGVNSWTAGTFTGSQGNWGFTATDAGYLSSAPTITRQVYFKRAWGYLNSITGVGTINEPVQSDSTAHFNNLQARLANETSVATSTEIKNAALFTPLTGTLQSARTYLATTFGGNASPITDTCQKNFVILVTDGVPTGRTNGSMYTTAEMTNTLSGGVWTFGTAAQDAINAVTALRTTTHSGTTYDVQTYVIALGDSVQNASAVAVMNAMANAGGTSSAYLATNASAFQVAFEAVAFDIQGKTAAASAVAVNSQTLNSNSRAYQARFTSSVWSGQLLAFPLTGGVVGSQVWDAGVQLNGQDWNNGRAIITRNATKGIPFRWTTSGSNALTAAQQLVLNTNPVNAAVDTNGSNRLDYLRGDCSREDGVSYRLRTILNVTPPPPCMFKLGDIANSAPFYVSTPSTLPDSLESVANSTFRASLASRPSMIYVGANDGMLHGFADADGSEKIGYVPNIAFGSLNQLTNPLMVHRYFVDGSPVVGDVFGIFANGIGNCPTTGCWRTTLAGTLAGGGKGVFALDITDPTGVSSGPSFSESNADKISLWEFTDSVTPNDMGYVFGQPIIVKLHSKTINPLGTGDWAVVFGNGYNSVNENAVLYVVSITNGTLIAKIPLVPSGYSATGNSNGLSSPTAFDTNNDFLIDYIYVGDLRGNMWKIDMTSSTPGSWGSSYTTSGPTKPAPLFRAVDGSSVAQPITEKPYVSAHPTQSGQMVYFGTGRYVATTDNAGAASPVQTFYGIWDGNPSSGTVTTTAVSRTRLLAQTFTTVGNARTVTSNNISNWGNTGAACNPASASNVCMGWRDDLLTATTGSIGEMSVFQPVPITTSPSRIVFTTLIPLSSACSAGGTSWLMEVDPSTGGVLGSALLDINGDGVVNSADLVGGAPAAGVLSTIGIEPNPVVVHDNATGNDLKVVSGSSGAVGIITNYTPVPPPGSSAPPLSGRKSWRQLQ